MAQLGIFELLEEDNDNVEDESDFNSVRSDFNSLSLSSSDWTVETLFSQIDKGNIELSPGFQRREVWDKKKKSAFIESLILNIPVPQIVIAQRKDIRGKYIVLDGKQRLLSILRFYENDLRLQNLDLLNEINGETYEKLDEEYRNALDNATIRAVRLSGWQHDSVLYTIFHRLNTGSASLNTQELRSALYPGSFTTFAASYTEDNFELAKLFSAKAMSPDFRMRDIELLTRYCGIAHRPDLYGGSLKVFLDETTKWLNEKKDCAAYAKYADEMNQSILLCKDLYNTMPIEGSTLTPSPFSLIQVDKSSRFNRAVFDAICFALQDFGVHNAIRADIRKVAAELQELVSSSEFITACSLTTKTKQSLVKRVSLWSNRLHNILAGCPVKSLTLTNDGTIIEQCILH